MRDHRSDPAGWLEISVIAFRRDRALLRKGLEDTIAGNEQLERTYRELADAFQVAPDPGPAFPGSAEANRENAAIAHAEAEHCARIATAARRILDREFPAG